MQPKPEPAHFHVAILGGGIGGLTTALSLSHHCSHLKISVFEQAPAYTEIGAGVGINVAAARILHALGVGDAANTISGSRNGIHRSHRRWDTGAEIVTVRASESEAGEVRQLSVHRAELLDVLLEAVKATDAAALYTNKKVTGVHEVNDDRVEVRFADGSAEPFDLVVAADGIHSAVRAQFVPDEHPRYSGRIAYRGLLPLSAVQKDWPFESFAVSWLAPGKHFLAFPISRDKTLNVVAFVSTPVEKLDVKESWSSTAPREQMAKEYEGWNGTVERIIENMQPEVGKWRLNDRELLGQWTYCDGKVVLLGDAAHAMLPHQGSGAGHAIEDAWVLGRCLKDFFAGDGVGGVGKWTKVYQDVRLPRAQKAQVTSRQAGDVYEMEGAEFEGKSFEECLPLVRKKLEGRMKWVWGADVDQLYEQVAVKLRGGVVGGMNGHVNGAGKGEMNSAQSEIPEMRNGVKG